MKLLGEEDVKRIQDCLVGMTKENANKQQPTEPLATLAFVQEMTHPSEMEPAEKKRQREALRRRMSQGGRATLPAEHKLLVPCCQGLPPGVLEKYQGAKTEVQKCGS